MSIQPRLHEQAPALKNEWAVQEHRLPAARYTDPEFARLEKEKLWPHVWQMACRTDELRHVGSYMVYDILKESIVIVRTDKDTLKAYHNVCPHRATLLAVGSGRFQLKTITCPYHGWKWNLDGENIYVMDQPEFCAGELSNDELKLHETQIAEWMGSVWINLDPDAAPFADYIAPIKALLDPVLIDRMRFYWHKQVRVPANWKVSQEAFMEAYHVGGTHPQILRHTEYERSNSLIEYETFRNGHSIFKQTVNVRMGQASDGERAAVSVDDQIRNLVWEMKMVWDQHDALVLREEVELAEELQQRGLPENANVGAEFQTMVRDHYDAERRPMAEPEALLAVSDCHIFPNLTFLPLYGNILMYRVRPTPENDPDWCIFDMYSLRTYGEGVEVPDWHTEMCDDVSSPDQFRLVPRQDFSNIPRQQRGMHSSKMKTMLFNERQETNILNMHRELDRYLVGN